ncbi:LAQU0S25e00562g1_1 [Lachancea quebecensis]|uniref:LAQU0S25e00562g1_1 n=1 Tax=Lachancea quebecensis TaxID=1654605 RepID=A0A0P1KY20_9SACH|nr:LAQU0S25e00562g1_1 [Lachancea quebecensis]
MTGTHHESHMLGDSGNTGLEAVDLWKKGVLKEKDGLMMDAIGCYRRALKMDEEVEKRYRKQVHQEIQTMRMMEKLTLQPQRPNTQEGEDAGNADSSAKEAGKYAEENDQPCWILEMLPGDILKKVVREIVLSSGESWLNLSLTCKRFQQLCFEEPEPYRTFAQYIYSLQYYDKAAMALNGLSSVKALEEAFWGVNYKRMLEERPYVKFQGCYISVVNYLRHGASPEGSSSWISPVHMITYYRYFRFYPDGSCLRLVTTDEPSNVVRGFDCDKDIKNADLCHWSLSIDDDLSVITITRRNDKYSFEEKLRIHRHAHKRHQRLKWMSSGAFDDRGERIDFSMRNEKPFSFSRVTSYKPVKGG